MLLATAQTKWKATGDKLRQSCSRLVLENTKESED